MTRIACTGHRNLPPATQRLIHAAVQRFVAGRGPDLIGICCLADGADQIFARAILDAGGRLEAVVPAQRYRDRLPSEAHAEYDTLFAQAVTVHKLPFTDSTPDAHMRASQHMLDLADELLAIWDHKPARGYGGTADVVADARQRGMTVHVIWPPGATRDTLASGPAPRP